MTYTIERYGVTYNSTGGILGKVGSSYFWDPIENSTYIGVNRVYAITHNAGSGVCRVSCATE